MSRAFEQAMAEDSRKKEKEFKVKLMTVDENFLVPIKQRYNQGNWPMAKWIIFCETMIEDGWTVKLYDSKSTVSKYLYISKRDLKFKIRFSNHKPNYQKETQEDCDFYVGVGHLGVMTTEELIQLLKGKIK